MSLKFTNTLTRQLESFTPIKDRKISIYCCGVTVYDLCHLGHARSYIAWDVLRRYLIWRGYEVTFVQNFTDIDDKILVRAAREESSMQLVSDRNIEAFKSDMALLNILPADRMPRATKCLDGIRSIISDLEKKGVAYSTEGDVYFSIKEYAQYGKLSGKDLSKLQEGASGRISASEEVRKKNSFDFALWKKAKIDEPSFTSPWGLGRPGWHIECSTMVREELGETIDIHLGGADLIFPHHENEIAQSEMANGKNLANYWLHNGMVNVNGQKMSKSLGNFTTIRELLASGISPLALRLFVLQTHYRKPLDFNSEALKAASIGWANLNIALSLGERFKKNLQWDLGEFTKLYVLLMNKEDESSQKKLKPKLIEIMDPLKLAYQNFITAMDEDLNTSAAIAILFKLAKPLRSLSNRLERGEIINSNSKTVLFEELQCQWQLLIGLASILGLRAERLGEKHTSLSSNDITVQIKLRNESKAKKDFLTADRIRDFLKDKGIELIDKPGNITEWIQH
uniref:Cysteine--tRNA ligase n=1 Tax=Paulinella chromatophora TaxID=39717 RepID=B1X3G6_PAUCH|nr:cysteinyl-tRNA synthetase [Paulinella chromatophora]ACB42485.1 cysteinyl-tRNA synthetase [Paulinella chromatophora]